MEMWSKIFDHLFKSSPWDLMSCSEACKEWNNLLEPRRSTYLMAEVFHPISKLLDPQEVLKCRLVCHSWNIAVNEVVSYSTTSIGFTINFRNNAASIKKIANMMTSRAVGGSINPFFSRSINLTISSRSRYNSRFQTAFRSLLARFGCEILSFQFNTFGISIPTQEQSMSIYKVLRYCLENLPNLMDLFVGGPILPNQNPDVRTLSNIETLLKEEPLPPLEYLSQLTMFYPNDLLEKRILLEYGNKIQDFSLEFGGYSLAQFLDSVVPIKMDKLTELWIRPVEMEEDILSMGSLKWPLTFLTLDYMVDTVKLETVFQAVSHFGDTLEILFVTVGGDDGNENWVMTATTPTQVYNDKNARLNLPHLTNLWIEGASLCFKTIDFLLPCSALQRLRLEMMALPSQTIRKKALIALARGTSCTCFGSEFKNVIKFSGNAASSMYKSNIWDFLPDLDYFHFGVSKYDSRDNMSVLIDQQLKIYTRNGYDSFGRKLKKRKSNSFDDHAFR